MQKTNSNKKNGNIGVLSQFLKWLFVEMVLSHFNETFGRPTILCFRKLRVSKMLRIIDGGCNQGFSSKLICLTVPILFLDKYFCVSQKNRYQSYLSIREGTFMTFRQIFFRLAILKYFLDISSLFQKKSDYEKLMENRGWGRREGVSNLP